MSWGPTIGPELTSRSFLKNIRTAARQPMAKACLQRSEGRTLPCSPRNRIRPLRLTRDRCRLDHTRQACLLTKLPLPLDHWALPPPVQPDKPLPRAASAPGASSRSACPVKRISYLACEERAHSISVLRFTRYERRRVAQRVGNHTQRKNL